MCSVCGDPNPNQASVQARLYQDYGKVPSPDYKYKIQVPVGRGAWQDTGFGSFQSKMDAWAFIDHWNEGNRWLKANVDPNHNDEITQYRLVEVPAWPLPSPEQMFINIAKALDDILNGPDLD